MELRSPVLGSSCIRRAIFGASSSRVSPDPSKTCVKLAAANLAPPHLTGNPEIEAR
jgi:hypothetical protein